MSFIQPWLASLVAAYEPGRRNRRPDLMFGRAASGAAVVQRLVLERPFCQLIHLDHENRPNGPRMLVVAPLSGHFSALLQDFLASLLPEHDLYVTDWTDAREVPLDRGDFGVEQNIDYILDFLRYLGSPIHLVALCQSGMPALAATALLAARDDSSVPRTLTLINSMLDTRINPTRIARFAQLRPVEWFENNMIRPVPTGYPGEGRPVYSAETQHAGLMAYLARHVASAGELARKVLDDDGASAVEQPFLAAYLSVMDLPAAFFLDTIKLVFQEFALPRDQLEWRGERVDPRAITTTALMTVEGEHDDVSGLGQTRVAHDLCSGVPGPRRRHYLQPGVGHFGTFHGRIWRTEIMPRIRAFVRAMA